MIAVGNHFQFCSLLIHRLSLLCYTYVSLLINEYFSLDPISENVLDKSDLALATVLAAPVLNLANLVAHQ